MPNIKSAKKRVKVSEKKNLQIVRATIVLAHALNLSVLAEGVENRQHFEILKDDEYLDPQLMLN